ncbi:MAG: outer membrane lipoprotein-sorting protein [Sedimentisphaerales bacterium]|nr:outer membrane lipoprotein-sorting protein [Sedimentisphaerales bacterium]
MSSLKVAMCLSIVASWALASEPNEQAGQLDVQRIVEKAYQMAYYQGDDGRARVTMTITDKQGRKKTRQFVILRKDIKDGADQMYFVYFQSPSEVRRMAYLVHKHVDKDDDRWLYLPALGLERRIAAGDKRTSFVGSDFMYEDVSGRSLREDVHELADANERFYKIKNTPKDPQGVEFSYYLVGIDKSTFVPVRMQYYDKAGKPYRVIEALKIERIQDFPTVVRSVARDLVTGSQTEMEFSDIRYNIGLSDEVFTNRSFSRTPREALE